MQKLVLAVGLLMATSVNANTIIEKLSTTKDVLGSQFKVTVTADLKDYDIGQFKEFSLKVGHTYIRSIKAFERTQGIIHSHKLIVPANVTSIEVGATELDEFHGVGSIDTLIAAPFNYFNPNDVFISNEIVELENETVLSGKVGGDSLKVSLKRNNDLIDGPALLQSMKENIKSCKLERSPGTMLLYRTKADHLNCRDFTAGLYIVSQMGFSTLEIMDFLKTLAPTGRKESLELSMRNIDWYERNFVL